MMVGATGLVQKINQACALKSSVSEETKDDEFLKLSERPDERLHLKSATD
jgi:hypothetical protein